MAEDRLNERLDRVLALLVKAYLKSGQPVGSRYLAETGGLGLSAASIRNAMHTLEKLGYLYSQHTSAGRIPTDKGLRRFVDVLMEIDEADRWRVERRVSEDLSKVEGEEELILTVGEELARLSRYAGLVAFKESGALQIRRIELLPVSSEQLLAVIITEDGRTQNKLLKRPRSCTDDNFAMLSHELTRLVTDHGLAEAKARLLCEMVDTRHRMRGLINELIEWAEASLRPKADVVVRGQRQLLDVPELTVIDTLRSLLTAFEEKVALLDLIAEMEHEERGVKAFIGSEHALVNMEQVSFVLARFQVPGRMRGSVGVIGPRRMAYHRVIPLVAITARCISRRLGGGC